MRPGTKIAFHLFKGLSDVRAVTLPPAALKFATLGHKASDICPIKGWTAELVRMERAGRTKTSSAMHSTRPAARTARCNSMAARASACTSRIFFYPRCCITCRAAKPLLRAAGNCTSLKMLSFVAAVVALTAALLSPAHAPRSRHLKRAHVRRRPSPERPPSVVNGLCIEPYCDADP
jgi:hypothetical protein